MPFSGHNFIAGQRSALGDTLVYSVDAHTGERLPGGFHQATLAEVDAAVNAATAAFPTFRNLPAVRRAEFLEAIAEEIENVGGSLNAYTGREITAYHASVLKEDVALGVEMVSDILRNSVFDPDELQRRLGCFADVRVLTIADAGHNLQHDQPEQVAAVLEDFLCGGAS